MSTDPRRTDRRRTDPGRNPFETPFERQDDRTPVAEWQAWWRSVARTDDPVVSAASGQGFVLRTSQLRDLGVSRSRERTRIANGSWTSPAFGVTAPVDIRDPDAWLAGRRAHALSAASAALLAPGHVVSGRSAAVLDGLPTFRPADPLPVLTVSPRTWSGRRGGSHGRRAGLVRAEVGRWHGTLVTTTPRTLVDLARHDRRDGIVAADAALREGLVTRTGLFAALDRAAGWPGVRDARAVLAMAAPEAESPLESIVRLALADDGFPTPELQFEIGLPGREFPYVVDFCWPQRRLVLEADGRIKYHGDALWREKQREQALRRLGYRVERVLWADAVSGWPATAALLRAALDR